LNNLGDEIYGETDGYYLFIFFHFVQVMHKNMD